MKETTTPSAIFRAHEGAIQLLYKSQATDIYELLDYITENPETVDYNSLADLKKNQSYLTVDGWMIITISLIMLNDENLKLNISDRPESPLFGSHIDINEREANIWHTSINSVSFFSFYPSILYNIIDDYRFNIEGFNQVYKGMYELRMDKSSLARETYMLNKVWLNMSYGVLASGIKLYSLEKNIIREVTLKGQILMKKLQNEFIGHFIYVDTDTIYYKHFNEIKDRLLKILRRYPHLRFEIESCSGIFHRKKSYILQNTDGSLTIKGVKIK